MHINHELFSNTISEVGQIYKIFIYIKKKASNIHKYRSFYVESYPTHVPSIVIEPTKGLPFAYPKILSTSLRRDETCLAILNIFLYINNMIFTEGCRKCTRKKESVQLQWSYRYVGERRDRCCSHRSLVDLPQNPGQQGKGPLPGNLMLYSFLQE